MAGNGRNDGRAPGEPVSRVWLDGLSRAAKAHAGLLSLVRRLGVS